MVPFIKINGLCSLNVTINPINVINPWEREGEDINW